MLLASKTNNVQHRTASTFRTFPPEFLHHRLHKFGLDLFQNHEGQDAKRSMRFRY